MSGLKTPVQIVAATDQEGLTTTAETVTIPNNGAGARARYIMLSATVGAAIEYMPFTGSAPADTALALLPADSFIILNVTGLTSLRLAAVSGTPTAYITPLENM